MSKLSWYQSMVWKIILLINSWAVLIVAVKEVFVNPVNPPCTFEGYIASCIVPLMNDIPIDTTIIINHCHKPIDITFLLKCTEITPPMEWNYTFVTANHIDSLEIPGLHNHKSISLHVTMDNNNGSVELEADFHVDDNQDVVIIHSSVQVESESNCFGDIGQNGKIAIGVFLTLLLLAFCFVLIGWVFCRRRRRLPRNGSVLVDNMEVGVSSPSYPLSPSAASPTSNNSTNYNVSYRPTPLISIIETNNHVVGDSLLRST